MLSYFGYTARGIVTCNPGMCLLRQSQCTFGHGILSSHYRRSISNPHKWLRRGASWLLVSVTLCSTLCYGGGTYGARWRSPGGRFQWCYGLVSVWLCLSNWCEANFCFTRVMTLFCFFSSISRIVVTSSSITSRRCSFHMRKGSWQCCGNNSADPDILYAFVSGTKNWLHQ